MAAWAPVGWLVGSDYDKSQVIVGIAVLALLAGQILVLVIALSPSSAGRSPRLPATAAILAVAGFAYLEREHGRFGVNISAGLYAIFAEFLVPTALIVAFTLAALIVLTRASKTAQRDLVAVHVRPATALVALAVFWSWLSWRLGSGDASYVFSASALLPLVFANGVWSVSIKTSEPAGLIRFIELAAIVCLNLAGLALAYGWH